MTALISVFSINCLTMIHKRLQYVHFMSFVLNEATLFAFELNDGHS